MNHSTNEKKGCEKHANCHLLSAGVEDCFWPPCVRSGCHSEKPVQGCLKKEAYKTESIAQAVKEKREKATGKSLRVYACGGHFHLTSMVNGPEKGACTCSEFSKHGNCEHVPPVSVQEKGTATVCPHGIPIHPLLPCKICSPDTEEWEKEWRKKFGDDISAIDTIDADVSHEMEAFISKLLKEEKKKAFCKGEAFGAANYRAHYYERANQEGVEEERQRIGEAAKDLLKYCPNHEAGVECYGYDEYYNEAIHAVLRIIKGEDIRR